MSDPSVDAPVRALLLGNEWVTTRAGGLNRYLADLIDALAAQGVDPRAVVVGEAPRAGGRVHGVSSPDALLLTRLVVVFKAAARLAPSTGVVDAHFALYSLAPVVGTRLRRLPLVVHFQGPWAEESAVGRGERPVVVAAKRVLERAVYRRADAVVVLSEAFGRLVVKRYGVDPSRVRVMPPGVDLVRFQVGDKVAAREALGVESGVFCAVAVRRLDARMGLDTLLDAWAEVRPHLPDAVLLVAGEGRERERLETQTRTLGLTTQAVRFLGRVDDDEVVRLYQAADCSVTPTRALEGFGLVVLESLACGTPAIVTDVGGLPEALASFDTSLVVPSEDPPALARRLVAAAGGTVPEPAACRAHAERFSWDDVARRHIDLYREVAGLAGRRPRVVFLDHCAQLSGGEIALARLLSVLGVDAHVILAEDGPLIAHLEEAGATVEVLPMAEGTRDLNRHQARPGLAAARSAMATAIYTARLARRLRCLRPDVVHTNSLKSAIYGGLAARVARVPVIWHVRDRIADDYLPSPAVRAVRAAARRLPNAIIANSQATLETLCLPAADRMTAAVVPSAVVSHVETASPARSRGTDFLTVGIVGRLAPWKGQDVFLDAFASAFPSGEERAVVVGGALFGEDTYEAVLRAQTLRLGLGDRVEFTGHLDEVDSQYSRFDVLVHASTIPEPFGQVIVEGMAAGLAVLAAGAGGPLEIITDAVDGLLYHPGDVDALAALLRKLAGDPDLRTRLGAAGRRRASEFTPERAAAQVMVVYRSVLDSPPWFPD